jgi:hypothetical protein
MATTLTRTLSLSAGDELQAVPRTTQDAKHWARNPLFHRLKTKQAASNLLKHHV